MSNWSFLYSDKSSLRLIRHLAFWVAWTMFQLVLYSFTPSPLLMKHGFLTRIYITLPETLIFLVPQIFLTYTLMYVVITRFVLPGKYVSAVILTVLLIAITALLSAWLSVTVVDRIRYQMISPISPLVAKQPVTPAKYSIGVAMLAGLRGCLTIGGIASAIKLMKSFYEKQQAAVVLEREKIRAELHLLKAQLHPHFLFNTLNNIYSLSQATPTPVSAMILRLSGMLRYILYDGSKEQVPLDGELKMIDDYIKLEALRYDNSLDLNIELPANTNVSIAPLILLPFVENAFKHGTSRMIERPWISLRVELKSNHLSMVLVNGCDPESPQQTGGIGITNVKKRLDHLYPQKHTLQLRGEEELFYVSLTIEL